LELVSWNLQFAGGRRHFFYDGGREVRVGGPAARATLAALRRQAERGAPDFLLLQEVDRHSARTGFIDELAGFVEDSCATASTPYHRCAWVPVPAHAPLGRVDMHLAVVSRRPLGAATRRALPVLREGPVRRIFNLRRALLAVEVPLADGRVLALANTHLSAFSHGDGTVPAQVAALAAWMDSRRAAGQPFLVAGDLNALPPGDDPQRLPDASQYADAPDVLAPLLARARSAFDLGAARVPTYQPFGQAPDRVLDYVFASEDLEVGEARVESTAASDHLPLRVRFRVV
jgi:endonuclease/exonuclease/phosphatase family metal-dependent hydrolase